MKHYFRLYYVIIAASVLFLDDSAKASIIVGENCAKPKSDSILVKCEEFPNYGPGNKKSSLVRC